MFVPPVLPLQGRRSAMKRSLLGDAAAGLGAKLNRIANYILSLNLLANFPMCLNAKTLFNFNF